MTFPCTRFALLKELRGFAADQRGVSAIEFAILLPLMLTLYLGGVEVSQAVSADRKTTLVAHTVGDLTAQASNVASSDVTNIFNAATAVAYPLASANLSVTLSSVCIDSTGTKATIGWSQTLNGTARSGTVTSLVPSALMVANSSLIWGEAHYAYRPTIGWTITGTLNLGDQFFLRPRLSCSVTLNSASGCC
ncbi:MAG TPA: TadE/TadG family type IV pilus assembly protein [Xanthobacteraceae bacterium]